jgi:3'(2'), 5'-bisphosphate nucleotidase
MRNLSAIAEALLPVVLGAADAILKIYDHDFAVQKKQDNSPLTLADLESQRVILQGLHRLTPDIPVLSEESAQAPWEARATWRELWVVDPLDGTREFIKRNGEFTVNVALVVDHEAVLGVIGAPARQVLYWGGQQIGAYTQRAGHEPTRIHVAPPAHPLRVAASRSHASPQTAAYLAKLDAHVLQPVGSSLKFCLIAEGNADLYPRFGPTSEWDTAAGQAILEAAGGHVTRFDGHRLRYNCRESLINSDFIAFGDKRALPD